MTRPIRLAISTCPNDTFAFHAILNRRIDLAGLDFEIELLDIERLNRGLFADRFDVAKASFSAALSVANKWIVLPSGAALGMGVGPLLLASRADIRPASMNQTTLCPGEQTTATLLFRLFFGNTRIEHVVFSAIMPDLQSARAEFGVCIHEGRFMWQRAGLFLVEDLGTRWERETSGPLPLGGILARRDLPPEILAKVQRTIRSSIEYGWKNREETLPTMRQYAQEFDDDLLLQHVDLYVNDWTLDLGAEGRQALKNLSQAARKIRTDINEELQIYES